MTPNRILYDIQFLIFKQSLCKLSPFLTDNSMFWKKKVKYFRGNYTCSTTGYGNWNIDKNIPIKNP